MGLRGEAAEHARARAALGVAHNADWATIRAAYRAEIRVVHPDVAGGTTSERTIELNAAYRILARSRRPDGSVSPPVAPLPDTGSTDRPTTAPATERPDRHRPVDSDARVIDRTTVVLTSTPEESFRRMIEAASILGNISYIDRSAAIFEAVLALEEGIHASLVVSLQWRAHDATCEAFCTLEALERAETLDVSGVIQQLLQVLPPDAEA